MKGLHCFRNSPARITTVVVPSPTCAPKQLNDIQHEDDIVKTPCCMLCALLNEKNRALSRINADLCVLRHGDVRQDLCCWMNNVQQFHNGCSII